MPTYAGGQIGFVMASTNPVSIYHCLQSSRSGFFQLKSSNIFLFFPSTTAYDVGIHFKHLTKELQMSI